MAKFNVGDLVIGTRSSHAVARDGLLCVVKQVPRWNNVDMKVEVVGGKKYYANLWYNVYQNQFDAITLEEYLGRYPDAVIDYGKLDLDPPMKKDVQLHMDMSKSYAITEDERNGLVADICNWFDSIGKKYKKEAIERIVDKWVQEKGWIIEIFKKHPNYNGKYQIVFSEDYPRKFDVAGVQSFARWINNNRSETLRNHQYKTTAFGYNEAVRSYKKLRDVRDYMRDLSREYHCADVRVNGRTIDDVVREMEYFEDIIRRYNDLRDKVYIAGEFAYEKKAYEIYERLRLLSGNIDRLLSTNITEEDTVRLKSCFPNEKINITVGRKLSRTINEIMHYTGMSEIPGYEKAFAAYSDAVNPVAIKRYTVLSVHPIDYLTMSDGNSWHSCHSIRRDGAYHSGTLSYMLDRASFVYYTVDSKYNGNEIEKQPKITRCMFHMGNEKLVQGRVYPQSMDSDNDTYLVVRNIVRRVLATALGIADDWTIQKGTSACDKEVTTKGTHYPDYLHSRGCNVSRIKRRDRYTTARKITVGARPICIRCGKEHNGRYIKCSYC